MEQKIKKTRIVESVLVCIALIFCGASCNLKKNKNLAPQQGVYYSLFVRSFADSNGDGIGDLNGIIAKLDYLEKLGITGIWLLPIYPSLTYHGYDVDDYYNVKEEYGTIADLENLCTLAAARGIAIILDIPLNHSSINNPWFMDSMSEHSEKRNWYRWANSDTDKEINFQASIWGHKVWNNYGGNNYYSGLYFSGMPDFNHDNPEVREEFKKILKFWLDKGVSGFRFDAASHLYNATKLPSSIKDGQERAIAFWKGMCDYVKSVKSDAYMVGEVWESTGTRADYMRGLPSTFHFDLGAKIINSIKNGDGMNNSIAKGLMNDYNSYAEKNSNYIDAPFLTNHDQNRFPLQFKNKTDCVKLAAAMYLFLPGIPFIYYGEEIGMNGAKPDEQIRTPFIWTNDGSDNLQAKWIESIYNAKTVGAAEQLKDKNSILNFYKRAVNLRTTNQAMLHGKFAPNDTGNTAITSWTLTDGEKKAFMFFNLSDEEQTVSRPPQTENFKIIFEAEKGAKLLKDSLVLLPKSAVVLAN